MSPSNRRLITADPGFTLVEMMTSVGLLLVVMSAAWLLLGTSGDNLNRIQNGSEAGEANRAALAAIGRDIARGVVRLNGSSPILSAEPRRMAILTNVDADAQVERVVWEADDSEHTLVRGVTDLQLDPGDPQPQTEDDFDVESAQTTTTTILTGLAESAGAPLFDYFAGATDRATLASDVGLVKVHMVNGMPTPTANVVDRTSAFRVVAFVINGYN